MSEESDWWRVAAKIGCRACQIDDDGARYQPDCDRALSGMAVECFLGDF